MFRWAAFLTIAITLFFASAATPTLTVDASQSSAQLSPVKLEDDVFENFSYPLGDFSGLMGDALMGQVKPIEGEHQGRECHLEFGLPSENFSEWIHPVAFVCDEGLEANIWPLGEGSFRKGYTPGRYLLRGSAAETLNTMLLRQADSQDVESPVSLRVVAWGPSNAMRITTLRRSDIRGNLHFSLECYSDEKTEATLSCALQF